MPAPEIISLGPGHAAVFAAAHSDSGNEDSAALATPGGGCAVLILADGAGGQRGGELASSLAVDAVLAAVVNGDPADLRPAILDGFEEANRHVLATGGGGGTTLSVVEIRDGLARPYHVGDSVIAVFGNRGKVKLETVAHSPVGYAVESGMLHPEDAIHHEERHMVSNLVGDPAMRIEVGPAIKLAPLDTVVLGSDGVFDNLHVREVNALVRKGPLTAAAEALQQACDQRMHAPEPGHPSKPDDVSFILFRSR